MSLPARRVVTVDVEAAVLAVAQEQSGSVARRQVLALGGSDSWIAARLRAGRWQRVFAGTYVVFSGPVPFVTRVAAALLRAGDGALLWGRTAAVLDGLDDREPAVIHVLVPARRRVELEPGISVRRSREVANRGHPVRSPARTRIEETVLDLCEISQRLTEVASWVTRSCSRRLTNPERLRAALAARGRHRWRRQLVGMLADVQLGAQSPLELEYLRRVVAAHSLPLGVRQQRLAGRTVRWVDVDHEDFRTRVELDGRLGHAEEGAFRDRQRDNAATRDGRATLRYGFVDVFGEPCAVAAEVAQVLSANGWPGQPIHCGPGCPVGRQRGGSPRP
jgi:hypothetical protein